MSTPLWVKPSAGLLVWPERSISSIVGSIVGLVVAYYVVLVVYRIWFHPLAAIPGPKTLAASEIFHDWRTNVTADMLRVAERLHRRYGKMVRIGPNTIVLDGSIAWPEVYAARGSKAEFGKLPGSIFDGDHAGIIAAPYETHRRMRRQLAHGFSSAALREQDHIVRGYVEKLIDQLTEQAELGKPVDVVKWFHSLAFDIIGDLVYGESFHSLDNPNGSDFVRNIVNTPRGDAINNMVRLYPLLKPFASMMLGKELLEDARRATVENAEISHVKARKRMELGAEPDGRRDISTYMLKKSEGQEELDKLEIEINSQLLIGAGSDTTASVLSGLVFFLAHSPERTATLLREVHGAFKNKDEITQQSSLQLDYLRAFIQEVMRLYPAAAATPPRVSPGAKVGGKWLPAGTVIQVYQYSTYRNPENFRDADEFRPERWLPATHPLYDAAYESDNKASFKPFSFGPRDCIGKNLAYFEMHLVACRLLYSFDVELLPGQEDWIDQQKSVLVWSKPPLNVRLRPRKALQRA